MPNPQQLQYPLRRVCGFLDVHILILIILQTLGGTWTIATFLNAVLNVSYVEMYEA